VGEGGLIDEEARDDATRSRGSGRQQLGKLPKLDVEEMPRVHITRQQAIAFGLFVVSALAFLYFVLPKLAGLRTTWDKLDRADPIWLVVAAVLELASFVGYVMLFRAVFVRGESRIGWRESYEITMAGLAASRLFAAAGSGGVALTAWALRRSGLEARIVACRMVAFLVLMYSVYLFALILFGVLLRSSVLPGNAPWGGTILPAAISGAALAVVLLVALIPGDLERRLHDYAGGYRRAR